MGTVKAAVKALPGNGRNAQPTAPRSARETGYVRHRDQEKLKARQAADGLQQNGAILDDADEQSYGAASMDLHKALKKARRAPGDYGDDFDEE